MNNQPIKSHKFTPLLGIHTRVDKPYALVAVLVKSILYDKDTREPEMIMGDSFIIVMN